MTSIPNELYTVSEADLADPSWADIADAISQLMNQDGFTGPSRSEYMRPAMKRVLAYILVLRGSRGFTDTSEAHPKD